MARRSIPIFLLIVTFLLSAWGNVIAAAFCPRYLSNRECNTKHHPRQPKQVDHKSSCHQEMADMQMGDTQMDNTETENQAVEPKDSSIIEDSRTQVVTESEEFHADLPTEPCGHCWVHSQPASGTATLVAVDPTRQLVETNAPPAELAVVAPSPVSASITPVEHGPPGNLLPRHVLINVFRI
jgi:hypothetical protein